VFVPCVGERYGMGKKDTLGATLTRLRHDRGLAQEALAFKAGLSTSTISRIERGLHVPDIATLRKLAKALNVPLSIMLDAE
jgi:XRE family transcriptional regulator, regulator of sulfur utilization